MTRPESEVVEELLKTHFEAINETDPKKLKAIMERVYSKDVRFIDPFFEVKGIDELSKMYDKLHQKFPGYVFRDRSKAKSHHGRARIQWELLIPGNAALHTGDDFVKIENGKLSEIVVIIDGQ